MSKSVTTRKLLHLESFVSICYSPTYGSAITVKLYSLDTSIYHLQGTPFVSVSSFTSSLKLEKHSQLTHSPVMGTDCLFFVYLFGVICLFQHYRGHITTGSWKGRGNWYIQLVDVLYCKLPTNGKQLPAFPLEVRPGTKL